MTISQQQLADAISAEGADISALATGFAGLTNAVDLLIAAVPGSPDFQAQFDAVVAQRTALSNIAAGISTEMSKIVPAPPVTPPAPAAS